MTDRHLHCVYFKYNNPNTPAGECLLHKKTIEYGYYKHCKDYVPRPSEVLSYYLVHNSLEGNWFEAEKQAKEYINKIDWFNDYPQKRGKK